MPLKSWLTKGKSKSPDKRKRSPQETVGGGGAGDADGRNHAGDALEPALGAGVSALPQSPAEGSQMTDGNGQNHTTSSSVDEDANEKVPPPAAAAPETAAEPWRVERIRPSGPPCDADWWEEEEEEEAAEGGRGGGADNNNNNNNHHHHHGEDNDQMDVSLELDKGDRAYNCNDGNKNNNYHCHDRPDDMSLDSQGGGPASDAPPAASVAATSAAGAAGASDAQALSAVPPSTAVTAAACCGVDLVDLAGNLAAASEAARSPAAAAITASEPEPAPSAVPMTMDGAGRRRSVDSRSSAYSSDDSYYSDRGTFRNVGLETWQLSREAWRTYGKNDEDEEALVSPANIHANGKVGRKGYSFDRSSDSINGGGGNASSALEGLSVQQQEEVLRGLTRVTRTYQLPRKVSLPDMVALLNDIWDCEKDY
jgi:hypothetical protein